MVAEAQRKGATATGQRHELGLGEERQGGWGETVQRTEDRAGEAFVWWGASVFALVRDRRSARGGGRVRGMCVRRNSLRCVGVIGVR